MRSLALNDGNFVQADLLNGRYIHLQKVDANGTPLGISQQVELYVKSSAYYTLVSLPDNKFGLVYHDTWLGTKEYFSILEFSASNFNQFSGFLQLGQKTDLVTAPYSNSWIIPYYASISYPDSLFVQYYDNASQTNKQAIFSLNDFSAPTLIQDLGASSGIVHSYGPGVVFGTSNSDTVNGTSDYDVIIGGAGADDLSGNDGDDQILAEAGDDIVDGGGGNDFIDGGDGVDTVRYLSATNAIAVNLSTLSAISIAANNAGIGVDQLYGIENVIGGNFSDELTGDAQSNTLNGGSGADMILGGAGNDTVDGGIGTDTAIFGISTSAVTAFTRISSDNYVITSSEGSDSLSAIEYVQFQNGTYSLSDFYTLINPSAPNSSSSSPSSNSVSLSATYSIPVRSIQSIGLSPDGHHLIIKVGGVTSVIGRGESLGFSDSTLTTEELVSQVTPIPVFKSSGGTGGYALPELYTGPASLGLKYQLIESADNAVVTGSSDNDFIKVASANSIGKAVNGGGGNDVIDGGVGSTFVTGGANHNTTFFLDGRAPGVSWSTITDFRAGVDKATIWGFVKGVSSVDTSFTNYNNEGAGGYQGLTLHFKNLLPDGQTSGSNPNLNSITLTGHTLQAFGASSLADLNNQINNGTNAHFIVGATNDSLGTHSYLFVS